MPGGGQPAALVGPAGRGVRAVPAGEAVGAEVDRVGPGPAVQPADVVAPQGDPAGAGRGQLHPGVGDGQQVAVEDVVVDQLDAVVAGRPRDLRRHGVGHGLDGAQREFERPDEGRRPPPQPRRVVGRAQLPGDVPAVGQVQDRPGRRVGRRRRRGHGGGDDGQEECGAGHGNLLEHEALAGWSPLSLARASGSNRCQRS